MCRFLANFSPSSSDSISATRAIERMPTSSVQDSIRRTFWSVGKTVRPNYGYMSDNEHGLVGSFSETHVSSNVGNYGRIHVKFKKEKVKDRTTVTFNDSLGTADEKPPTPSIKPHFTGIGQGYSGSKVEHASKPGYWGSSYLEVQYHWPLKTELIDSIHISEKNSLSKEEMREVEELVREYNQQYPDKKINVVTY